MDEDCNSEGNDNDDDDNEFPRFDDVDDKYCIQSQDIGRSQTNASNDGVESSLGHHGSIHLDMEYHLHTKCEGFVKPVLPFLIIDCMFLTKWQH